MTEHQPAPDAPALPGVTRWRKRPVEVEAICWNSQNLGDVQTFGCGAVGIGTLEGGALPLWVARSSAVCRVEHGDWIIREPDGSGFYPCAASVFAATYEPAGETGAPAVTSPFVAAALDRAEAAEAKLTRLCPGCLHDGVLELTLERARAAEAKLAAIRDLCEEAGTRTGGRVLAIIGGEEATGNGDRG